MSNSVDHPPHYGGQDNPYEAIKVIEAWGLGFHLGNVVKYLSRAGKKGAALEDLKKARWYLDRAIARAEGPSEVQQEVERVMRITHPLSATAERMIVQGADGARSVVDARGDE